MYGRVIRPLLDFSERGLGTRLVLRLLMRPFWDRNIAIIATWLVEYCIRFLAVNVCIY